MFVLSYVIASVLLLMYSKIEGIVIAQADGLTTIFGSFAGMAALLVAYNTIMLRREAKRQKDLESTHTNRMDTFEMSQASLLSALARSDADNARLAAKVEAHETTISALKEEVRSLRRELRECHGSK